MDTTRSVATFCRICEAGCGLVADLKGNEVLALRPDRDHPVSQGYACVKGVRYREVHHSPDRLTTPLKRVGERFVPIRWEDALREIGARLRDTLDRHGPQGVGLYAGNPLAFNLPHQLFTHGLVRALGTHQVYGAGSQDCNNKFVAAREMYGSEMVQPIPDLDRLRCFIVIGSNPAVSQMTFVNAPRPIERMRAIVKAGGRVVFVNPRRTESAKQVGEQVFIRPSTDVYFLLSFACELLAQRGESPSAAKHLENSAALRAAVADWPAERTASVTGVPAGTLRMLVQAYREADGAALYAATGLNQGEHGTLAFWILSAINAVSGNLDRAGGLLVPAGIASVLAKLRPLGAKVEVRRSRIGGFDSVMQAFPAGVLSDEILTPGEGQIRAMIVSAGNPLLSCANSERTAEALRSLDLLVSVDLFRNETGNLAHYILPASSFLERDDVPLSAFGYQPVPYAQFAPAVVPPLGESREEWWIYTRLLEATGLRMFGPLHRYLLWSTRAVSPRLERLQFSPRILMRGALRFQGQRLSELRRNHPHGKRLPLDWAGSFLGKWVPRDSGKVDVAPARFVSALPDLARAFEVEDRTRGGLKLISKRERHSHNSWLHNVDSMVAGERHTNYVYLHPTDAAARRLVEGELADVRTDTGVISLPVKLTEDLMPGVVAVPHGWGHQRADGLSIARTTAGANVNLLAADGPAALERFAGMTHLTGLRVEVTPSC